MSFRDIFNETRRKIGGTIGNQVDNFRVGLNLKQPKNLPLSLAQDAFKLQSARRVLGKEGLGSAAGIREAGKGVLGGAVRATRAINQYNPSRLIAPKAFQRDEQIFKGIENRLAPRGNEVQKSLNTGFNFGARMAPYGPIEGAAIGAASKLLPRIAASKVGQFGIRRGADVLSGQLLSTPEEIQNMGGGVKGRLKIAGMDIVGGTAMEGAGRAVRPVAKAGGQKINLARSNAKMGVELPSRVKVGENAFTYNRGGKTIEVPNEVAEFYFKNNRMPRADEIVAKNYKYKGTTELRFQDGKFHGWDSDNDLFKAKIAHDSPSIGLSTKDISGKSDSLSNEARKATFNIGKKKVELPDYLYRGVTNEELNRTLQGDTGALLKSSDKTTYLSADPNFSEGYRKGIGTTGNGFLLRVKSDPNIKYTPDPMFGYNKGSDISKNAIVRTKDGIPLDQVEVQVNGKWQPIKFDPNTGKYALSPQSTQGAKIQTKPINAFSTEKGIRLPLKDKKATEAINTRNFAISDKGKANLKETVEAIKPELEKVKGGVLKNEEVVDAAKASKILSREVNPEATKKATAAVTRLRQEVAAGAEGKGLTKDFIENLKVLKSYSADAGRKLQAFNIKASPETSIKESIIADLVGLGKKSDDLIKAAKGVDFDNPKQVSKFYRQFVKPSLGEVLDEYRYINLLSSPQTHIVNAFSNLIQGTVLNPATKLYTGAIDSIGSTLTGKQRTAYMREVPAYSKGFINSMGEAFKEASEVMKGNKFVERPDINRLSTGKLGPGEYVMRALEAGDVFFRKMIKGGEMEALAYKASRSGKKIPKSVMEKQAADAAEYFVFRKAPDPTNKTGQGAVLSGIDKATEAVYKFRNVPGVKWVIPFVQTPMNILKQGLEYSPLGVSTMVGNTNKTQQLAKALIGSTVLAGAATLESTWDAPTSKNEKEEFYASGRKPYSVKIGDNWVSYSKLGPLAYPMAMAAAVKWYFENDPKATSTDSIDKMTKMLGGIAGFFADQSYLSGIGDLVDVAKGEDYAIKGMLANFGKQLVPLTSLQGWVARQLDPIYRQPKTITEQIKTGIPGLSKSVESYKDPLGNDSVRQNNTFNSWSPVNVNPANQQFEDIYQKRQLQKRSDAEAKALTSGSKTLSDGRVAVVINDEVKKFDSQQEADQAINKEKFKNSDKKAELIDGTYYYKKSDGDVGTYTEQEYNYKLRNAKMDIAYNKKDYKGWVQLANEKLKDIEKQYNEADPLTQQELLNDYQDLAAKIAKYSGYGGFTKGKSGGSGSKFTGITLPTTTAKIPIRQAKAPTFKNISSTPRIAIKTTKPKMISKSTLANMR